MYESSYSKGIGQRKTECTQQKKGDKLNMTQMKNEPKREKSSSTLTRNETGQN